MRTCCKALQIDRSSGTALGIDVQCLWLESVECVIVVAVAVAAVDAAAVFVCSLMPLLLLLLIYFNVATVEVFNCVGVILSGTSRHHHYFCCCVDLID